MLDLEYFRPILESSVGIKDDQQLDQFHRKLLNRILHSKSITLDMLTFDKIKEET